MKGQGTLPKWEQTNKLCDSPRRLVAKPTYHTIDVAIFFTFCEKSHRILGYLSIFMGKAYYRSKLKETRVQQTDAFNLKHALSGGSTDRSSFVSQSKIPAVKVVFD